MNVNPNDDSEMQPRAAPVTTPLSTYDVKTEPIGKRLVLDEQRRAFDSVKEASRSIDGKFQAMLASASLIVSLVGATQLPALKQTGGNWFWLALGATLILYLGMVVLILLGLQPA